MNLYGFAGGDPVNYSDPFGLKACPDGEVCPEEWALEQGRKALNAVGDFGNALKEGMKAAGKEMATQVAIAAVTGGEGNAAELVGGVAGKAVAGRITGFTKHGINQAISRDGVGVASEAILGAVKNPLRVVQQARGAAKYIGENATVILNQAGEVVTTWARNSAGWRIVP